MHVLNKVLNPRTCITHLVAWMPLTCVNTQYLLANVPRRYEVYAYAFHRDLTLRNYVACFEPLALYWISKLYRILHVSVTLALPLVLGLR